MAYIDTLTRNWSSGELPRAPVEPVDALLMDVARRIQLSPTKHDQAELHYRTLCAYVDREGSPLEGKVVECYPGGSFATGTAVASWVSRDQHDVDVVIELRIHPYAPPHEVLALLFRAINGEPGSRYHGQVTLNSRCVTVVYDDGVKVDLMPIARLPVGPDRAGHLFHHKAEANESYHKPVNPWGFARHFNDRVELMEEFARAFEARRAMVEGTLVGKADTRPMPDHVPSAEKSPRVVALQLLKKARDVAHRRRDDGRRKPPSIALAALALEAGPVKPGLAEEVIALADHVGGRIAAASADRRRLVVQNPAYPPDLFTDRWPEDIAAQDLFARDLNGLVRTLHRLRRARDLDEIREVLEDLFGRTAARHAVEGHLAALRGAADAGSLRLGPRGRVLGAAPAAIASPAAAGRVVRSSTFTGGPGLPE